MNVVYLNFNRVIQFEPVIDNTVLINERSFILGFVDDLGNRISLTGGYLTPFESYVQNDDVDVLTLQDSHFSNEGRSFIFLIDDIQIAETNVISKKNIAIQNAKDLTGNPELYFFNYETFWINSLSVGLYSALFGQLIYYKQPDSVVVHPFDKINMLSQYVELVGGPVDDMLSQCIDGSFFFSGVAAMPVIVGAAR